MQIVNWTGNKYLNPAWPANNRKVSDIKHIIVHHDAVTRPAIYNNLARFTAEAKEHTNRIGPGLQYHFKIDNVGTITQIRPLTLTLWHCGNLDWNKHSIAICVDGNFMEQTMTAKQQASLKALLTSLSTQHPEFPAAQKDVYPHCEVPTAQTLCPGKNLAPYVENYRHLLGKI